MKRLYDGPHIMGLREERNLSGGRWSCEVAILNAVHPAMRRILETITHVASTYS